MIAVMQVEIRKHLQDVGLIFWMIILPIIFTVLFIAMFTNGVEGDVKTQITTSIVPGYVVMFVFFIMISIVNTFVKDRDKGMVARLASTRLKPFGYLLGKWVPFLLIVMVQMFILFTFGKLIYDIPMEQMTYIIVIAMCLSFVATTLGVGLALIVKTENMGIAVTQIVALGGAMIGGLWMPLDAMPSFIQTASPAFPQYWAHQAMYDALLGQLSFGGFMQAVAVLCAIGCGAMFMAWLLFPSYLQKAKH